MFYVVLPQKYDENIKSRIGIQIPNQVELWTAQVEVLALPASVCLAFIPTAVLFREIYQLFFDVPIPRLAIMLTKMSVVYTNNQKRKHRLAVFRILCLQVILQMFVDMLHWHFLEDVSGEGID